MADDVAASIIIVRVLVDVLPQVSVATCDVSIKMFPDRTSLMKAVMFVLSTS